MQSEKYVYSFGSGQAEGNAVMKNLLGGKGANLAEMTNLGVPVPPGFTITTDICTYYDQKGRTYPEGLSAAVSEAVRAVETAMGRRFGDAKDPLLFSVRSGARTSMPGMMDTVLNLGLNDETVAGLAARTGNPRFAYDSYRRFVSMYGDVVMGLKPETKAEEDPFERILSDMKRERSAAQDTDLSADDLKRLVGLYKQAIQERLGKTFPEDPQEQLWGAISAVFTSWHNIRAKEYRRMYRIPDEWGTAVNVQAMVFGNSGERSGTGVAFTRDPATGENIFYGEYLINAQGEDVVAGIRTPEPISRLEQTMPQPYAELEAIYRKLENHYRDMQDMEFTIEDGRLWMLQTRVGKRTGSAAIRIAVEMVDEGLITEHEALLRVDPEQLNQLLRPIFDTNDKSTALAEDRLVAKGLNAGPGAACGRVVFSAEDAVSWADRGEKVILTRIETSPEDIAGMQAAEGILTAHGGMTSHAALVARQMGTVCVVGCAALSIDYRAAAMNVEGKVIKEGDWISIDGTTGEVITGKVKTIDSDVLRVVLSGDQSVGDSPVYDRYAKLMAWADNARRLKIRANADQPDQAKEAIAFGAEGIGLCRTEHMFFGEGRLSLFRRMILSDTEPERRHALEALRPIQRDDFEGIFKEMAGCPVTIRLLDPPLHEFLPHSEEDIIALAQEINVDAQKIRRRITQLKEFNPMLGHRGCRLGVTYPEVYEMQVEAIIEAACGVKESGLDVQPEIMIPLVGHVNEMRRMRDIALVTADRMRDRSGVDLTYSVGTMIELPRACLAAGEIAEHADFFSFGTNDLTQTTYGISRDDIGRFLPAYLDDGIYVVDPFVSIDREGMGQLLKIAIEKGRDRKSDLKVGICGEHGGDPTSVHFCHDLGMNYVSCSPYRVPVARLAAGQAAVASDS